MTFRKLMIASAIAFVAFGAGAKVKMQDLPSAVRNAVRDETRNAAILGITKEVENGKTLYELETKVNGRTRDLMIGVDGRVVSVEEETAVESIPAAARAAIETKARGGRIVRLETLTEGGKVSYEAAIDVKGKKSSITVAPDGAVIR